MKSLRERTAIQQAFLDGAEIDYIVPNDSSDLWEKTPNPGFLWHKYDYRVKPKPMVRYINMYKDISNEFISESREHARENLGRSGKTVKFIEALDD